MRKTALVFIVLMAGTVLSACGGGSGGGGGGVGGGGTPNPTIVGRWDAVTTSGPVGAKTGLVGDIGMLVTSQTSTTAKGTVAGVPFTGTITGNTLKIPFSFGNNALIISISLGSSVMNGTFTNTTKNFSGPISFALESPTPTSPFTGVPKVVSTSIVKVASLNEYAIVVTWDRPTHGENFSIVQGANSFGEVGDFPNFAYNPTTFTYTMPILVSAGLTSGPCTLSLESGSYTGGDSDWSDPYGAFAWTTLAGVYTANLVVP